MSEYGVVTETNGLRFERLLPGPVERVWRYLTDSELRGTWLASGEMELRVGGRVEHVFRNSELTEHDDPPPPKYAGETEARLEGRITMCDPPHRLAYTWPEAAGPDSEVTFELTPRGENVLLVLTHRRLGARDNMVSVAGGWHTHLGLLAARLNEQSPAGFWTTYTRLEGEYEQRIPVSP